MDDGHDHSGHDHGSHDSNTTDSGGHSDHMMSPYLFTRSTGFHVLFEQAFVTSTGGFIEALIGSFVFAMLTSVAVLWIHMKDHGLLHSKKFANYIIGSALYAVSNLLHYTAMLIVMTMNVWLILAVIAGHALGYLVFAIISGSSRPYATEAKPAEQP